MFTSLHVYLTYISIRTQHGFTMYVEESRLTEVLERLADEFRGEVKVDVWREDGRLDPVGVVVAREVGECVGAQTILGYALLDQTDQVDFVNVVAQVQICNEPTMYIQRSIVASV